MKYKVGLNIDLMDYFHLREVWVSPFSAYTIRNLELVHIPSEIWNICGIQQLTLFVVLVTLFPQYLQAAYRPKIENTEERNNDHQHSRKT